MIARTQIAGVDFSTREVHLVRRRQGEVTATWRRIEIENFAAYAERDAMSARQVGRAIIDAPEWWDDVWLCAVEYPFTMGSAMAAVGLKTIMGAIIAAIPEHVHVLALPARMWQPIFCNMRGPTHGETSMPRKSKERKPLIKTRALELLDSDDLWPQDAYDAFGLSWTVEIINQPALTA